MIDAKEARGTAKAILSEKYERQIKQLEQMIINAMYKGEFCVIIPEMMNDHIQEFLEQYGYEIVYDHSQNHTTIDWRNSKL